MILVASAHAGLSPCSWILSTAHTSLHWCGLDILWENSDQNTSYHFHTSSIALQASIKRLEATGTSVTLHQVTVTSPSSSKVKQGWLGCQPTSTITPRPSTYSTTTLPSIYSFRTCQTCSNTYTTSSRILQHLYMISKSYISYHQHVDLILDMEI